MLLFWPMQHGAVFGAKLLQIKINWICWYSYLKKLPPLNIVLQTLNMGIEKHKFSNQSVFKQTEYGEFHNLHSSSLGLSNQG
jgi:hypothetical protein